MVASIGCAVGTTPRNLDTNSGREGAWVDAGGCARSAQHRTDPTHRGAPTCRAVGDRRLDKRAFVVGWWPAAAGRPATTAASRVESPAAPFGHALRLLYRESTAIIDSCTLGTAKSSKAPLLHYTLPVEVQVVLCSVTCVHARTTCARQPAGFGHSFFSTSATESFRSLGVGIIHQYSCSNPRLLLGTVSQGRSVGGKGGPYRYIFLFGVGVDRRRQGRRQGRVPNVANCEERHAGRRSFVHSFVRFAFFVSPQ